MKKILASAAVLGALLGTAGLAVSGSSGVVAVASAPQTWYHG